MAVVLCGVLNDGVAGGCLPGCRRPGYVAAGAGRIVTYALSCCHNTLIYIYVCVFLYHWVQLCVSR